MMRQRNRLVLTGLVIILTLLMLSQSIVNTTAARLHPPLNSVMVGASGKSALNPDTTPSPTPSATPPPACGLFWRLVPSPNLGSYDISFGITTLSANDAWATGFYVSGTVALSLIEHWDGSVWSIIPGSNPGSSFNFLSHVAARAANDVWTVGDYTNGSIYQTLTEHWNGSSWSAVSSPNQGSGSNYLSGVAAIAANDAWAVGNYANGSLKQTLTEHWNGASWSIVPSPNLGSGNNQLFEVKAVASNDVWAVGTAGVQSLIEHWDGSNWNIVSSPNVGSSANSLNSLTIVAANNIWTVGSYSNGGPMQSLVEQWNGSTWSVVPSANGPPGDTILSAVTSVTANDIWAVGYSGASSPQWESYSEHWDGTSWSSVPMPPGPLSHNATPWGAAAVAANDIWSVGDDSATMIEHYSDPCANDTPTATPTNPATSTPSPTNTPGGPTSTPAPPTNTPAPSNTPGGPTDTPAPPTVTPTDCPNPFVDITGNIFYTAIHTLYCRQVVNGVDATHYSPGGTSTRGQFAKVVVLGFGLPFYTPGMPDFTDVPTTYFAYLYIETGFHAAILNGFDASSCTAHGATFPCYLPNLAITRGQLTKLVVSAGNYALFTPTGGQQTFSDVPPSNVFFASIETAHHNSIINGYPDGTFRPNNNIRRDEMAQIVYTGIAHMP